MLFKHVQIHPKLPPNYLLTLQLTSNFLVKLNRFLTFSLQVERYQTRSLNNLYFSLDGNALVFADPIFSNVARTLNVSDDGRISCNTQTVIKINTVQGPTIEIRPENYIDMKAANRNGTCASLIDYSPDEKTVVLPLNLLHKKCFQLDFKEKRIGLANYIGR